MKKDDFDLEILENADNEVIDALNSFPSADEETKRRVFSMSEKKFNDLNNNFEATDENSVKGVETYRRPKWYRTVCVAAAALVLVGGGTATFAALHKTKKSNESMQATSEIETSLANGEDDSSMMSEEAKKILYEHLFFNFWKLQREVEIELDKPINYYFYYCDAENATDEEIAKIPEMYSNNIKEENGKIYVGIEYYKLNSPYFSSLEEYYRKILEFSNEKMIYKLCGDVFFDNKFLEEHDITPYEYYDYYDYHNFAVYDNGYTKVDFSDAPKYVDRYTKLYTQVCKPDSFDPEKCEITYEKSFPIDSDSFIWESYYRLADDPDTIRRVNVYIENVEGYGWRIFDFSMDQCEYEEFKDYQGGEYPSLMEDVYKEALLNKDSELTSESTKTQESTEENAEPETVEDITEPLTAEPNKAISDYSDEELQNISMLLMNKYVELDHLPDSPYLVPDEIVTFANPTPSNGWPSNEYIRLDDPRFSNLEELVAYYSPYIEESLITYNCDNRNEFKEGDLITEELYPDHLTLPEIIEFNGKLYTYSVGNLYDSVVSCEIKEKNQNGFQVVAQTDSNCILTADIVKTDEDTFRIEKCWWDIT